MARAADEASRAVDAELKGSLLRPVLADSLADMLLQILPTAVAFDDPGAAWVRAPLFRLVHTLLLCLAALQLSELNQPPQPTPF